MKKILVATALFTSTIIIACGKHAPATSASNNQSGVQSGTDDTTGNHPTTGIPAAVIASFNAKYPSATGVEYEKQIENGVETYKVQFFLGADRWEAFFKPDGTFISERRK